MCTYSSWTGVEHELPSDLYQGRWTHRYHYPFLGNSTATSRLWDTLGAVIDHEGLAETAFLAGSIMHNATARPARIRARWQAGVSASLVYHILWALNSRTQSPSPNCTYGLETKPIGDQIVRLVNW